MGENGEAGGEGKGTILRVPPSQGSRKSTPSQKEASLRQGWPMVGAGEAADEDEEMVDEVVDEKIVVDEAMARLLARVKGSTASAKKAGMREPMLVEDDGIAFGVWDAHESMF